MAFQRPNGRGALPSMRLRLPIWVRSKSSDVVMMLNGEGDVIIALYFLVLMVYEYLEWHVNDDD